MGTNSSRGRPNASASRNSVTERFDNSRSFPPNGHHPFTSPHVCGRLRVWRILPVFRSVLLR